MEYECKILCQFTTTVGGTRCCIWLKQSQSNSLQGHTKHFFSYLKIEPSGSSWKATGYSNNGYLVTLKTNYGELEIFIKNFSCGPVAMSYKQIERRYTAFCVQQHEQTDVENCTW